LARTHYGRGNFNLVGNQREKNNGVVNFNHANSFNDWIHRWGLIELKDPGRTFTWSDNQECPIIDALDRILVSVDWASRYPLVRVSILPKVVSDHNPLLIHFGDNKNPVDPIF
jgi:endonuclease/exonuclease/phosphatase family metal-dependent hydrolase